MENTPSPPHQARRVILRWVGWISGIAALLIIAYGPMIAWRFPIAGLLWPFHMLLVSAYIWLALILFGGPLIWAALFERREAGLKESHEVSPDWSPMPEPHGPRSVIVLVHGTFARHASWTLPRARLPIALRERSSVVAFAWSGVNSMRARRIAVQRLREHILRLVDAGYGPISLVGHSHAGNIILKACEDPATAAKVRALVCLSTPFISAWRPPINPAAGPWGRWGVSFASVIVGAPIMALSVAAAPAVTVPITLDRLDLWAGVFSTLVLAIVVMGAGFTVARRFQLEPDAKDEDIDGSVCSADAIAPLAHRTLILSRAGDEADGILKLASAVNRSMLKMHDLATEKGDRTTFGMAFKPWLQGAVTIVASVASLAFGANGLKHPTGTYLTSSETPPGTWTHMTLGGDTAMTDLYHSSLYDDERAVAAVEEWIERYAALGALGPTVSKSIAAPSTPAAR